MAHVGQLFSHFFVTALFEHIKIFFFVCATVCCFCWCTQNTRVFITALFMTFKLHIFSDSCLTDFFSHSERRHFSCFRFRYIHTEDKEDVHGFSFTAQLWTTE